VKQLLLQRNTAGIHFNPTHPTVGYRSINQSINRKTLPLLQLPKGSAAAREPTVLLLLQRKRTAKCAAATAARS
jgi:hypothetical protein